MKKTDLIDKYRLIDFSFVENVDENVEKKDQLRLEIGIGLNKAFHVSDDNKYAFNFLLKVTIEFVNCTFKIKSIGNFYPNEKVDNFNEFNENFIIKNKSYFASKLTQNINSVVCNLLKDTVLKKLEKNIINITDNMIENVVTKYIEQHLK